MATARPSLRSFDHATAYAMLRDRAGIALQLAQAHAELLAARAAAASCVDQTKEWQRAERKRLDALQADVDYLRGKLAEFSRQAIADALGVSLSMIVQMDLGDRE